MPAATKAKSPTKRTGGEAHREGAARAMRGANAVERLPSNFDRHALVRDTDAILIPERDHELGDIISGDIGSLRANHGDVDRVIADEAFMHELIAITVPQGDERSTKYAPVTVNDKTYHIPRGRLVRVPRFVVEALAHAKQADFETNRSLPGDPRHMVAVENTRFSYPFAVKHDPSGAKGEKWLDQVLNDPN